MYIEAMENMQRLPDYAKMFRGKPLRFVLPLNVEKRSPKSTGNPTNDNAASGAASKSIECDEEHHGNNLITLRGAEAEAYLLADKKTVFCVPECLCDLGCETPRINYENKLGKQYRYFYAISSDVDALNPGTVRCKTSPISKERKKESYEKCMVGATRLAPQHLELYLCLQLETPDFTAITIIHKTYFKFSAHQSRCGNENQKNLVRTQLLSERTSFCAQRRCAGSCRNTNAFNIHCYESDSSFFRRARTMELYCRLSFGATTMRTGLACWSCVPRRSKN